MKKIRPVLLSIIIVILLTCQTSVSQITQEWVRTYSSSQLNAQIAYDAVTDTIGNVYVTGTTERGQDAFDIVTVKYNSAGDYIWGKSYDFPGYDYSNETGRSITSYRNGSKTYIYCAGVITFGTNNNIIVMKYDEYGNQLWVKNFSYAAFGYLNQIPKVMSDPSGNCYVSGGSGEKPYVVKYDSAGTLVFGTVVPKPAGAVYSGSYDMAFDVAGNIYITGDSDSSGTNSVNYFTSKLNSAGVLQWSKIFRGAFNYQSRARKIAVGVSGNVYVTGEYQSGTMDYLTIKYNPVTGDTLWTRKFNGTANSTDYGRLLALDASENIYVSGITNNSDIATVKCNSSGVQQWVKTYSGPGGYPDEVKDIAIDNSGNIYLTGISDNSYFGKYLILKYNQSGTALWTKEFDFSAPDFESPYALTLDNSGNVIVTGSSGYENNSDFGTIKYNSSGTLLWAKKFYGAQLVNDVSNEVVTDKNGNVYTVGFTRTNLGNNITVIKYNSSGVQKWIYNRGGGGVTGYDVRDEGNAIAVDTIGNVYFTGTWYYWLTNKQDICTGKLDSNGVSLWFIVESGLGTEYGDDEGKDIAVDASGNVYVTGQLTGPAVDLNYITLKYNSIGVKQWSRGYGTSGGNDIANMIALDLSGNVFVTGTSDGSGTGTDIATIKYSSAGVQQWIKTYNGTANGNDIGNCVGTDDSGNVYVAGSSYNTTTGSDLTLLRYKNDVSGTLEYVKTHSRRDGAFEEVFNSMIVQSSPLLRVYLAGNSYKANSNNITTLIGMYVPSAMAIQENDYLIPGSVETKAYGLAMDNKDFYTSRKIYMTGITKNNLNNTDIFVKEYFANGPNLNWIYTYNGNSNGNEEQGPGLRSHVAVDNNGKVYISGSVYDSVKGSEIAVMKMFNEPFQLFLEAFFEGSYYQNSGTRYIKDDTVVVYLKNNSPPYTTADSAKGMLDIYGNGTFFFSNISDGINCYIVVKHRNSIETWSNAAEPFNNGYNAFTFKDAIGSAYGNNMATVDPVNYDFGFYSGDVNQDGYIDLTDITLIFNAASIFASGYIPTDLTGDSIADLTDLVMAYNNSNNFVSIEKP